MDNNFNVSLNKGFWNFYTHLHVDIIRNEVLFTQIKDQLVGIYEKNYQGLLCYLNLYKIKNSLSNPNIKI